MCTEVKLKAIIIVNYYFSKIILQISNCTRKRACCLSRKIWLLNIIPGSILAIIALFVYSFVEGKENYPLLHSSWHALVAIAVLILIPPMDKQPSLEEKDQLRGKDSNETYYELISEEGSHLARHPFT